MARRLVILGTSVTVPDPGSAVALAASFRDVGGHLADLEGTLQALSKPDAWGDWTGQAAGAFGQSIGQLPGELGDIRDAYDAAAAALQQYAAQLEPVVSALISLSFQAEEAEGTLTAVRSARNQAMAHGQDSVTTGWDARLADATAAVASLRSRLARLLSELTALAARCAKQIGAAEPKRAGKSLFGALASDFVKDVADPLGRAAEAVARGAALAGGALKLGEILGKGAFKLDELVLTGAVTGVVDLVEAAVIHPITDLPRDVGGLFDGFTAEKLGRALGDVAGILGIVALIPGADVIAVPALLLVSGAAAGADWWAAAHHEQGASYLQAALATVSFGAGGVGYVAGRAVEADSKLFQEAFDAHDMAALKGLADGTDARASGAALWKAGLPRPFTLADVKASVSDVYQDFKASPSDAFQDVKDNLSDTYRDVKDSMSDAYQSAKDPLGGGGAKSGAAGLVQAVTNNARSKVFEVRHLGLDEFTHSPAAVTIEHVKFAADSVKGAADTALDQLNQRTESPAA